jgi:hypothetical protein
MRATFSAAASDRKRTDDETTSSLTGSTPVTVADARDDKVGCGHPVCDNFFLFL